MQGEEAQIVRKNIVKLVSERTFMYTVGMKRDHKKIINFFENKKRMPSYQEIADLYGFKSKNAAYTLAKKFIDAGFVKKDSAGKLLPIQTSREIPLLGYVQAGFPTAGEETMSEGLSLDDWLAPEQDATYILKVSGDSMKDAGIIEGDYVIVERGAEAADGDIVIAEVDSE